MDVNILQQVVSILLEKGAKVDHEDKEGMTPLLVAAFEGHRWVYTLGVDFGLVKFETLVCKIFSCFASLTHSDSHNQMKLAIRMFVLWLFNLHQDYYLKSIILSTWTIFPRPVVSKLLEILKTIGTTPIDQNFSVFMKNWFLGKYTVCLELLSRKNCSDFYLVPIILL